MNRSHTDIESPRINWLSATNSSKPEDQLWVQTEFKKAIAESTLEKVVLMPPFPEIGQDIEWLDDWEEETKAEYEGKIDARLFSELDDVRRLFSV